MFLLKLGGGLFQAAERGRARIPIHVMHIAQNMVGNARGLCQGELLEPPDGGPDGSEGLIDQRHGLDDNRIIKRPSSVSRETSLKKAIAELCDPRQNPPMAGGSEQRRTAIRRFMKDRGLKPAPWALSAGLSDGIVRNFLAGRAQSLTSATLEKLAAAADATVAELIGEKVLAPRLGKEVVAIKSLEVRASMGGGFEVLDEPEGPPFFFRRQWIEKMLQGMSGQLRVIPSLGGDSMAPTINDGDAGLVHMTGEDAKFQSGAIYALWDGQGLIVKRLESLIGDRPRLRIISDNKAVYEAYDVDAEGVRIIGRLIWRGGKI